MNLLKNKKFLTIALGIFISLIMVSSILNIKGENQDRFNYNNYIFVKIENGWLTFKNNQRYFFSNNPKELENITVPDITQLNSLQKIYFSLNPENNLQYEISLFNQIKLSPLIVTACFIDTPQCSELPLKTCNDTTSSTGIIIFKESNITKISLENNCLTIQGKDKELIKHIDKLILKFLGI